MTIGNEVPYLENMAGSFAQISADALALPPKERGRLAERLLESISKPEGGAPLGATWEEIQRRLEEIDNGTAETIPAEEVFAELRKKYGLKPVRFHVAAEEELRKVRQYYEASRSGLGNEWLDAVATAVRQLQRKPMGGRPVRFGTRKHLLKRFPYYIIFVARDADLFIVSLMHVKRNPGYWVTRL